jgi:hypothetical protein
MQDAIVKRADASNSIVNVFSSKMFVPTNAIVKLALIKVIFI